MKGPYTRNECLIQFLEHATTPAETLALQKDISKFNNIQMARKINSTAYGPSETNTDTTIFANAEAIISGQVSIRWIEESKSS